MTNPAVQLLATDLYSETLFPKDDQFQIIENSTSTVSIA